MAGPTDGFVVSWPTLGYLIGDWIERHCIVPDGWHKGDPFVMPDWQFWCAANHYRVKPEATIGQLAPAFRFRRSQVVAPQKTGKGPWAAAMVCAEAVGPVVFDGWADDGDVFACDEHGCPCGWEWPYRAGDPKGTHWPTPLIQCTATSEDQVDNVWRPLTAMLTDGPLANVVPKTGEEFIRLPNAGRIDAVTSNARSRLGQPITFALQDETGIWSKSSGMTKVADTQRRGLAGMGGRSMETTNAWDPAEESTAQLTAQATVQDIFRFHRLPPAHLSYRDKRERHRIHRHVYEGSWWVDLDAIEAEAAELLERDPAQAERFFGNRIVSGAGTWLPDGLWAAAEWAS